MTSQPGRQTITVQILPNISKNKDNHAMKFGQLIEYNVRNIFHQKLWEKWGKKTRFRPLFMISNSFTWSKSKWPTS